MVVLPRLRQCGSGNRLPGIVVWEFSPSLFGSPRVAPHHLMDLSILLFVVSIASNVHAMVHREDVKTAIRRVA